MFLLVIGRSIRASVKLLAIASIFNSSVRIYIGSNNLLLLRSFSKLSRTDVKAVSVRV